MYSRKKLLAAGIKWPFIDCLARSGFHLLNSKCSADAQVEKNVISAPVPLPATILILNANVERVPRRFRLFWGGRRFAEAPSKVEPGRYYISDCVVTLRSCHQISYKRYGNHVWQEVRRNKSARRWQLGRQSGAALYKIVGVSMGRPKVIVTQYNTNIRVKIESKICKSDIVLTC